MFEFVCEECGKVKRVSNRRDIGRFCSRGCYNKNRFGINLKHVPGCVFQPDSVLCGERNCGNCGWNPVVAKARLEAFKEKYNES